MSSSFTARALGDEPAPTGQPTLAKTIPWSKEEHLSSKSLSFCCCGSNQQWTHRIQRDSEMFPQAHECVLWGDGIYPRCVGLWSVGVPAWGGSLPLCPIALHLAPAFPLHFWHNPVVSSSRTWCGPYTAECQMDREGGNTEPFHLSSWHLFEVEKDHK